MYEASLFRKNYFRKMYYQTTKIMCLENLVPYGITTRTFFKHTINVAKIKATIGLLIASCFVFFIPATSG